MIGLLVSLLIIVLIFGAIWYVLSLTPLPHPFALIAQIVLGVVFIIILLSLLLGGLPWTGPGVLR